MEYKNIKKTEPSSQLCAMIPASLWVEVDELSYVYGVSKAQICREGIRMWLDQKAVEESKKNG